VTEFLPESGASLFAAADFDPKIHLLQLQAGCELLGIPLDVQQLIRFEIYYRELVEWNDKFNLTAITDYTEVQIKHFLDSLVALPLIAQATGDVVPPTQPFHLLDVGTGAGFPGIPLKLVAPQLKVTLMDGTGKKILFLRELVAKLGLKDVEVVQGRAEEVGNSPDYRAQFDLVTARAVASLNTLVEYLLPLVRRGGLAVIYKGASAPQELLEARKAIELLGGGTVQLESVQVPLLSEQRYLLLIKKQHPTPERYPRGQGLPRKKPLALGCLVSRTLVQVKGHMLKVNDRVDVFDADIFGHIQRERRITEDALDACFNQRIAHCLRCFCRDSNNGNLHLVAAHNS
jgi:16S rRNA (guanine527-N7)-methyltransferase